MMGIIPPSQFALDIALYLWILNLIVLIAIAVIFIRMYKSQGATFYLGVTFFYIMYFISRLCEVLRIYLIPTCNITEQTCWNSINLFPLDPLGLNFWLKTGYTVFSYIGLFVIYFVLERYIFTKTKFIFTLCVPIITIISVLDSLEANRDATNGSIWLYISIPFFIILLFGIVGMYVYLAIKSAGEVRTNSIIIIFGLVLFELGLVFALPDASFLFSGVPQDVMTISAPVLMTVG
ncbi:MAG: hypothetical protein ACTSRL_08985, partial [Candidatus Helarchaeota archaeon]